MLSRQEIEAYHEKGYCTVEGVLTAAEVTELRRVTDEFVEKSREVTEHDEVFDLEPDHTPEFPRLRRIKSPVKAHPAYAAALRNDRILDIVAQLIGGDAIRTNGGKLNMKSAEFGSPVHWHQDWAFYPHTNDDLLAVGVAIDDMTERNGCLMAIPGSHKGKIWDHHQEGCFAGAVTEAGFDDSEAELIEVEAGGISLHHVRALHASLPNSSANPRRLLLLQYCAGDSWPLCQQLDWDQYCASYVRGEPVLEPRMEEVPWRLPLPPALRPGTIYETQTVLKSSTFGG